jgi:hypothetical protein
MHLRFRSSCHHLIVPAKPEITPGLWAKVNIRSVGQVNTLAIIWILFASVISITWYTPSDRGPSILQPSVWLQ